ncbi:MAG: hypothetical protein C0523_10790 [Cytophaga sp.]|nr:hypothetical protein [Cytophaga sp.]
MYNWSVPDVQKYFSLNQGLNECRLFPEIATYAVISFYRYLLAGKRDKCLLNLSCFGRINKPLAI